MKNQDAKGAGREQIQELNHRGSWAEQPKSRLAPTVAAEPKTIKINLAQGKRDPGGAKMNYVMITKIRIFSP
jgi:hypothetical protein